MRNSIYCLLVMACVIGCGEPPTSCAKRQTSCPAGSVNAAGRMQKRAAVEAILCRRPHGIPMHRRYDWVLAKASDLWKSLGSIVSNDFSFVVLALARFQYELEMELNTDISVQTGKSGMLPVAKNGVVYYETSRDVARDFIKEKRSASEAMEYKRQLKHFLLRYPQRFDADCVGMIFEQIPSREKDVTMNEIQRILGRRPKWATRQPNGNDAQVMVEEMK